MSIMAISIFCVVLRKFTVVVDGFLGEVLLTESFL